MAKKHKLILQFKKTGRHTAVTCVCGEECGVVNTGTRAPEILKLYKAHFNKETQS